MKNNSGIRKKYEKPIAELEKFGTAAIITASEVEKFESDEDDFDTNGNNGGNAPDDVGKLMF